MSDIPLLGIRASLITFSKWTDKLCVHKFYSSLVFSSKQIRVTIHHQNDDESGRDLLEKHGDIFNRIAALSCLPLFSKQTGPERMVFFNWIRAKTMLWIGIFRRRCVMLSVFSKSACKSSSEFLTSRTITTDYYFESNCAQEFSKSWWAKAGFAER